MTFWTFVFRNASFHRKTNLALLVSVAISAAVLAGALMIGDTVRATLKQRALTRVFGTEVALSSGETFFRKELQESFPGSAALIVLPATGQSASGEARANNIQVLGIDSSFAALGLGSSAHVPVAPGKVLLSAALARRLDAQPGSEIILRIPKPGSLSSEAALAPRDDRILGWRLEVAGILASEYGGHLEMHGRAGDPLNAFVNLEALASQLGVEHRANLLLVPQVPTPPSEGSALERATKRLASAWKLQDAGLQLQTLKNGVIELRSSRVFIPDPVLRAATNASPQAEPILTYLANLLAAGTNFTPYSMVSAAGPPYTPADLRENEIVINEWLARDLGIQAGEAVRMTWFVPESGSQLLETTNTFVVRAVVPLSGLYADKTLLPEFPGIEEAEDTHDWKGGFPLTYPIREQDERYWDEHRGTPKAFVSLAAGQKFWGNRFGRVTAVRFPQPPGLAPEQALATLEQRLRARLRPEEVGLAFAPVRERALTSARDAQDFGELFLGFSAFLIGGALLLIWLILRLGLEARAAETGLLMASGFTGARVRNLYMAELLGVSGLGGLAGIPLGMAYARGLLWGLSSIWQSAVGSLEFQFEFSLQSLAIAWIAAFVMALVTVWLCVRSHARRPPHELIARITPDSWRGVQSSRAVWIGSITAVTGLAVVTWALAKEESAPAGAFFLSGTLLLAGALAFTYTWLARGKTSGTAPLTFTRLVLSMPGRRLSRSMGTIGALAAGCFLIVAVSAFRLDADSASNKPDSGTGGFTFIASSSLPVIHDLSSAAGQEALGFEPGDLADVRIVPIRAREGDEASCLNLSRAQTPRLLGIRATALEGRFSWIGKELVRAMRDSTETDEIPAVGDANSIRWAMGRKLGEVLQYPDGRGGFLKLRLAGAMANSILQGNLLIDEQAFVTQFPHETGYRLFLIQAPPDRAKAISSMLTQALEDYGFELVPAAERLNQFNAVQNTYLGAFQTLGALGLLLGTAGLALVILRNILDRRGELAVLSAAGFSKRKLTRLVLLEHGMLFLAGLLIGTAAAMVALLPTVLSGQEVSWKTLLFTLAGVAANGALWTMLASRWGLKANLIDTLKTETL